MDQQKSRLILYSLGSFKFDFLTYRLEIQKRLLNKMNDPDHGKKNDIIPLGKD